MKSLHFKYIAFAGLASSTASFLPAAEPVTEPQPTLPPTSVSVPADAVVRMSAEYFYFTRESEFLGQDDIGDVVEDRLTGNLAGIGLTVSPPARNYAFEFYGRAGELEAEPLYNSGGIVNRTSVTVTRRDFEAGIRLASPDSNVSIRFGAYHFSEDLDNLITAPGVVGWPDGTLGRDPADPKRYTRSLSAIGGYVGLAISFDSVSKGGIRYGLRLDGDVRIGVVESDYVILTGEGEEAEALYGLPHRATVFASLPAGAADLFGEVGAKGEYNFTSGAGVEGYDYGAFARLGVAWRF